MLGSGRLKKRTVVEGDTSAAKPRNGQVVKIHKKGEVAIRIIGMQDFQPFHGCFQSLFKTNQRLTTEMWSLSCPKGRTYAAWTLSCLSCIPARYLFVSIHLKCMGLPHSNFRWQR